MPAVYIDRRNVRVEYEPGVIVLRGPGEEQTRLPLGQVDFFLTRASATIDTRVLTHLADQGSAVVLMDGRGGGRTAFISGTTYGHAGRRIAQYRAQLDAGFRLHAARYIVGRKLRSQHRLLRAALTMRPDCRYALTRGCRAIRGVHASIRDAESVETLRGLEGAAAAAYFEAYAAILPDACAFAGRNRRPPRDPVNAALSLGYTFLQAEAVRALHAAGLDPMLGLYHEIAHGRDALACDLVELHRTGVDHLVWRLLAERRIQPEQFERLNGACLMTKAARAQFYPAWESWAQDGRKRLLADARLLVRHLPDVPPEAVLDLLDTAAERP